MAKLMVFAVVLVAFLAMVSANRTSIVEEGSLRHRKSEQQQDCNWLIQQQGREQILHCAIYLQGQEQSRHIWIVNPFRWREVLLQECCNVLENVESECRCEFVKKALILQKQEHGQVGTGINLQNATDLLKTCNLNEPQQCQIRVFYF